MLLSRDSFPIEFRDRLPRHIALANQTKLSLPHVHSIIGGQTPVIPLPNISQLSGRPCYAKLEYKQPSGAFKGRGAAAAISYEVEQARIIGRPLPQFIAASAGNHGAGVSAAAKYHGAKAIIYVPENAPLSKISLMESFGATVIKVGSRFEDALQAALEKSDGVSNIFIHPFDNPLVAAGQGTLALELMEQLDSTILKDATFFIQVGGGGLLAGAASILKRHFPDCKVVAVTDENVPALGLGLLCGRQVTSIPVTDADGTRVGQVGNMILDVRMLIDALCVVTPQQLARAMARYRDAFGETIEGAGALSLAACHVVAGQRIQEAFNSSMSAAVCIISGRNVDPQTFETVIAKAREQHEEHRHGFILEFPERPGMLKTILEISQNINIIALHYQQSDDRQNAQVQVEFESSDKTSMKNLQQSLLLAGITTTPIQRHHHQLQRISHVSSNRLIPRLIQVQNHPGAFLEFVSNLQDEDVIFLRYRAAAHPDHCGQVWMVSRPITQ